MNVTMTAADARLRFVEVLRQVVDERTPVVVEREGEPPVVILSVEEYERTRIDRVAPTGSRASLARAHEQVRRDGAGPLDPPVEEVIRELREERDAQFLANLR